MKTTDTQNGKAVETAITTTDTHETFRYSVQWVAAKVGYVVRSLATGAETLVGRNECPGMLTAHNLAVAANLKGCE